MIMGSHMQFYVRLYHSRLLLSKGLRWYQTETVRMRQGEVKSGCIVSGGVMQPRAESWQHPGREGIGTFV